MKSFTVFTRILVTSMLLAFAGCAAAQQSYPHKPIRMVVPFPPRSATDVVGRILGQSVAAAMDKQAFPLTPSTPEQLGQFVKEQKEAYLRILRAAGVQPE